MHPLFVDAQDCQIVNRGKAQAVIVHPGKPIPPLAEAISDLQNYIYRISKANIEVKDNPQSGFNTLWLLCDPDVVELPYSKELINLNSEGFIIRITDNHVYLIGRTPLGLQHAIYWLLEKWGCRWLFPGQLGEVIPDCDNLSVTKEMETVQQPRFIMRDLWYNWWGWVPETAKEDFRLWSRRNRMDYSLRGSIGHAYNTIADINDEKLFEEHPEYFPMKNGKRVQKGQICTSNPDIRKRAVDNVYAYFRNNPEATLVSMSPNDGGGPCRCDDCKKYRFFSDAALSLANYVADALKQNPETQDKIVAMYAYFITAQPPSIQARNNVMILVATKFNIICWRLLVKLWGKKAERIGIRDYANIVSWDQTKPVWRLGSLRRKVDFWDKNNIIGVSIESGNSWGGWGLYHYVMARLLWNPAEDVEDIFTDYLQKGFGTAADEMKRYFSRWKWGFSDHSLSMATKDLAQALKISQNEDIRRRIGQYVLYVHHLHLIKTLQRGETLSRRRDTLKKLIVFDWRLAATNMAHTIPFIKRALYKKTKRYFKMSDEEFYEWKNIEPFSNAEIIKYLEEDLNTAHSLLHD